MREIKSYKKDEIIYEMKLLLFKNGLKICTKCGVEKSIDEFYKNKNCKNGYDPKCKECFKEYYYNYKKVVSNKKSGYIYIIIHPLYPDWVKIGRSTNPKRRLDSYQTHNPTRSYKMYFKKYTNKINYIERYFKKNIFPNGHEWFKIKKEKAEKIIIKLIKEIESDQSELFDY